MTFTARNGQNVCDVCLNTYGTIDNIVKLLVDNNLAFEDIFNNTSINFTPQNNSDVNIYNQTTANNFIFSTGTLPLNPGIISPDGDFNDDFNDDFNNEL